MKKVIYIISSIDKALGFEWIASFINKEKFNLSFVLLNPGNSNLEEYLIESNIPVKRIEIKNGFDFFKAYGQLALFLLREKPDIIHCHLRTAELIGIPVAYLIGVKQRIYTRHSSTYNHLYHTKGVWVDILIGKLATDIVAVSKNVYSILLDWEHTKKEKIRLIPHGFDLGLFSNVPVRQIEFLKKKYKLEQGCKVIGIIARYTWWKGYAYSIPAIGGFMKEHPDILLVIANANGNDKEPIRELIQKHIPMDRVREISFESNLPALYKTFDYFVHVPFDATVEAFGQTYVEALAAGIPSVFTLSGIAPEFIIPNYNAIVVDFRNQEQIEKGLTRLFKDDILVENLVMNGRDSVKLFSLEKFVAKHECLYLKKEDVNS